jgi:hypothetical protein
MLWTFQILRARRAIVLEAATAYPVEKKNVKTKPFPLSSGLQPYPNEGHRLYDELSGNFLEPLLG